MLLLVCVKARFTFLRQYRIILFFSFVAYMVIANYMNCKILIETNCWTFQISQFKVVIAAFDMSSLCHSLKTMHTPTTCLFGVLFFFSNHKYLLQLATVIYFLTATPPSSLLSRRPPRSSSLVVNITTYLVHFGWQSRDNP